MATAITAGAACRGCSTSATFALFCVEHTSWLCAVWLNGEAAALMVKTAGGYRWGASLCVTTDMIPNGSLQQTSLEGLRPHHLLMPCSTDKLLQGLATVMRHAGNAHGHMSSGQMTQLESRNKC